MADVPSRSDASDVPAPPETEEPGAPPRTGWEYPGDSWPEGLDAEEIARLINVRGQGRADREPTGDPFFDDGEAIPVDGRFGTNGTTGGHGGAAPTIEGDLFGGGDIPGGDWKVIPPGPDPAISQRNETVLLPPAARLMYDWARAPAPSGGGWHQGDGGFSAFVWDALFDHFRHCWGKRIVVIDQTEVSVG